MLILVFSCGIPQASFARQAVSFEVNKKFLPYFLIAFMVNFYLIDTLYMIFIVSIFNVIWGQFAQQIIRPNVIYNIGGVAQALFLIIPYYF